MEVRLRAGGQGSVTSCAEATGAGGLTARDCATTAVGTATLDLKVARADDGTGRRSGQFRDGRHQPRPSDRDGAVDQGHLRRGLGARGGRQPHREGPGEPGPRTIHPYRRHLPRDAIGVALPQRRGDRRGRVAGDGQGMRQRGARRVAHDAARPPRPTTPAPTTPGARRPRSARFPSARRVPRRLDIGQHSPSSPSKFAIPARFR